MGSMERLVGSMAESTSAGHDRLDAAVHDGDGWVYLSIQQFD